MILDESGNLKDFLLVSPNKALDFDERVVVILKELKKLYDTYNVPTNELKFAIESGAIHAKGRRNELAMLNGAVYYFLKYNDCDVTLVAPSRLKKFATGNGRAGKIDMEEAAPKTLVARFSREYKKYDDLIDAYFLSRFLYSVTGA